MFITVKDNIIVNINNVKYVKKFEDTTFNNVSYILYIYFIDNDCLKLDFKNIDDCNRIYELFNKN